MSIVALDERLARRVGAATLCVLGLAVVFFVFIYDRIEWGSTTRIRVYLHGTGGLREGAALVVGGREIGAVESIARSPRGAPGPLAGDEGVVVTVTIDADDAAQLRRGVAQQELDVFVSSRGVLSSRYLELGPMPAQGRAFTEGEPLLGIDPPTLDRVLQRSWDNLMTVKRFGEAVRPELEALTTQLAALAQTAGELSPVTAGMPALGLEVQALIAEAERTFAALGGDDGLARISAVVARARQTIVMARSTIAGLQTRGAALVAAMTALQARAGDRGTQAFASLDAAIDRTRAAIDRLEPLRAKLTELQDRIARGEGSIGRIATDPEFPEDAKELGKILKRKPWRVIARPKD